MGDVHEQLEIFAEVLSGKGILIFFQEEIVNQNIGASIKLLISRESLFAQINPADHFVLGGLRFEFF